MMNEEVKEREEKLEVGNKVICTLQMCSHYNELGIVKKIKNETFHSGEKKLKIDYQNSGLRSDRASHIEIYSKKPFCEECEAKTIYHDGEERWICPFGHDHR